MARGLSGRAELGGRGERVVGDNAVSSDGYGLDRKEGAFSENDDDTHELDALLGQSGVPRAEPR